MFKHFKIGKKTEKEITLVIEDKDKDENRIFKVPKRLLVEHSLVFQRKASNGELKKSKKVQIDDITETALLKVIEYMRTSNVAFQNHYEAMQTMQASINYQVEALQNICSDFLITTLDVHNVCEIFEFALSTPLYNLEFFCLKLIDNLAEDVLKSAGFLTLKLATVEEIIKRSTLSVDTEVTVFQAVMTWGLNESVKQCIEPEKPRELVEVIRPLLREVRFAVMPQEAFLDPQVVNIYSEYFQEDPSNKRRSWLNSDNRSSRTSTLNSPKELTPREYIKEFVCNLDLLECDQHLVKNGEIFKFQIEMLKGRVFLNGVGLAFDTFAHTKDTACLYASVSGTNVSSADQKSARGTFLNSAERAVVRFSEPLVAKESEKVEIVVSVKRAENICPLLIKNDVQVVMPETKDVAMKVVPQLTEDVGRCIFREIIYFC